MKKTNENIILARRISEFLYEYAPTFLTASQHTLKAYKDSLTLYIRFLEESGVKPSDLTRHNFEQAWIEKWLIWLRDGRHNSPETCNNRLAALRRFLEFLGQKDVDLMYLYQEAKRIKRQKGVKKKVLGRNVALWRGLFKLTS